MRLAPANAWRLLLLGSHYRSPVNLTPGKRTGDASAIAARLAPAAAAWQKVAACVAHTFPDGDPPLEGLGVAHPVARACELARRRFIAAHGRRLRRAGRNDGDLSLIRHANGAATALQRAPDAARGLRRTVGWTVRELSEVLGFTFDVESGSGNEARSAASRVAASGPCAIRGGEGG